MNKNWLYRVLALVLIAMLALPVALAEEVEEVEAVLGAEGAVEDLYLGNDGADAANFYQPAYDPDDYQEVVEFGFDKKTTTIEPDAIDAGDPDFAGVLLWWDGDFWGGYEDIVNVTFKSSKTSVADFTGKYYGYDEYGEPFAAGYLAVFKTGKTTLTIKAKVGKMSGKHYKTDTRTCKVKLKFYDSTAPETVKTFYGDAAHYNKADNKKSGHNYGKVDMGISDNILMPVPYDADDHSISYSLGETDTQYEGGWNWKWSNSKIAFFQYTGGNVYKDKQQSGEWMEDYWNENSDGAQYLQPVFYKPGTATVTFTSKQGKKKATAKFTVKKKEKSWKVSKKTYGIKGDMAVVVKKIKYTDMDHAEVTIVCYNDAHCTWKKGDVEFTVYREGYTDEWLNGTFYINEEIKQGQTKTFTLKFDKDDMPEYPELPDLEKGKWKVLAEGWDIKDEDIGGAIGNEEA